MTIVRHIFTQFAVTVCSAVFKEGGLFDDAPAAGVTRMFCHHRLETGNNA